MKTKKTIHVSSSGNVLNFTFPKAWSELSQTQLRSVLVFLSVYSAANALVRIVCFFANLIIVRKLEYGDFHCILIAEGGQDTITLSADEFTAMCDALEWVLEPGNTPVLLTEGRKSIDAMLHGVPFETYIMLENLYQGFLMSKNKDAVVRMAEIIFEEDVAAVQPHERFGIVQWFTQVKSLFAREFPDFFRPLSGAPASVKEAMNAQIRALTGGDVTKEQEVLAIDTWRALEELNAKAREAEEFKKSIKK